MKGIIALLAVLVVVAAASVAEGHKKFYSNYDHQNQGCVCDCSPPAPVLPNKPFYGSGGYAQQPPRLHGGYGHSGGAVAGSYGGGSAQVSGGY